MKIPWGTETLPAGVQGKVKVGLFPYIRAPFYSEKVSQTIPLFVYPERRKTATTTFDLPTTY